MTIFYYIEPILFRLPDFLLLLMIPLGASILVLFLIIRIKIKIRIIRKMAVEVYKLLSFLGSCLPLVAMFAILWPLLTAVMLVPIEAILCCFIKHEFVFRYLIILAMLILAEISLASLYLIMRGIIAREKNKKQWLDTKWNEACFEPLLVSLLGNLEKTLNITLVRWFMDCIYVVLVIIYSIQTVQNLSISVLIPYLSMATYYAIRQVVNGIPEGLKRRIEFVKSKLSKADTLEEKDCASINEFNFLLDCQKKLFVRYIEDGTFCLDDEDLERINRIAEKMDV